MTTDFRTLCADLVRVADALDGRTPLTSNQGQALDGYSALAEFRHVADRARAALADEPPAGEVAELVAWLREQADHELGSTFDADYFSEDPAARNLNRAADLLQDLSPPQLVPVSERLPGQEVEG